eukprot:scaffold93982_cov72-Phaeocystis_antarctica.AAC.5
MRAAVTRLARRRARLGVEHARCQEHAAVAEQRSRSAHPRRACVQEAKAGLGQLRHQHVVVTGRVPHAEAGQVGAARRCVTARRSAAGHLPPCQRAWLHREPLASDLGRLLERCERVAVRRAAHVCPDTARSCGEEIDQPPP